MPGALARHHQPFGPHAVQCIDHRGLAHVHQVGEFANRRQLGAVGQAPGADGMRQLIDDLLHQRRAGLEFNGGNDCTLNLHFTGLSGSKVRWILYELALIRTSLSLYHALTDFSECQPLSAGVHPVPEVLHECRNNGRGGQAGH
ncbi:hypothetical protein D9M71_195450 [compost metagenome]